MLGDTDNPSPESMNVAVSHMRQQSNKEQSVNSGMLVYVSDDGKRFEAPPTEEGIRYMERMYLLSTSGKTAVSV